MNVPPGTPQPTPGIDTPEPHARSAGAERPRVPHGPGGAPDATLPELFEEAARRSPGAVALAGPAGEVTYGELDRRSAELARRLRARGVRPETRVGVCMGRTPELVAALLAVLRAGGAYVPLDPGYPRERLRFMLADSGAALLLADPAAAERLVDCGVEVMVPNGGAGYEAGSAQQDASSEDAPLPHSRTPALSHPSSLAYVVYTSGSTGTPKGVLGTHRGIVNRLAWMWSEHPFAAGEVCCQKTSLAFVDSVWEVFGPLLAGVPSVLVPDDEARDPEALAAILARHGVTRVVLVPSLLRALLDRHPELGERCPRLRLVVSSGEELPPGLARRFAEAAPGATLLNLYGSSEVAADCTAHALPPGGPDPGERVPIGRPIRNTRVHVAGAELEPVPEGAAGELCVAGAGLARGYMGNPAATAEAFVPDPFGGAPGERMYRTGDRGRRLPDGTLEFLGREDHQVKVRGVRVELREVEAALRGHAGVADAVVVARGGAGGDAALVAYVVPAAPGGEAAPADAAGGRTEEWTALWDDTYRAADADGEPALNVAGWMSSYTREPIPREEMREWVDRTVERILALRPERVLEVGFGTGMLLFRVAPRVRAYHGTELSPAALEYVGQRLDGLPGVRLSLRGADRLDGLAAEGFDTVVVNCVVQYFPGVDYLLRVLEGAAACLRPGGRIFVGDVRSLPLLEAYHASVELFRAPGDLPARTLRARVRRAVAEEKELVVDPALFHALRERIPRLGRVEVLAKRSVHDNEVVRYRCDVVLHLDGEGEPAAAPCRAWGDEVPDPDALRRLLAASPREPLAVLGIPDARLARDFRALELLARDDGPATAGELRAALAGPAGAGVDPEALWRLGESLGREVEVRPGEGGRCDALFHPAGGAGARAALPRPAAAARPPRELASDPGWERRAHALVPALRASLRERLPEPMVPASFVVLDALPLTPSGKTDRLALPAPDPARAGPGRERVPPRTEVERRIAAIWEEVLGVEAVGVRDGFLELGGHSLLGTRVTMRLREALGVELPLRALFEAPTVEQLARRVEAGRGGGAAVPAPLERAPRDAPLPLSFGQQRLWFLHRMQPLSPFYNESTAARLRGPLDARALRRALGEIVRRHEALRTVFPTAGDEPVQVVLPPSPLPLPVDDLSGLPGAERDVELRRRLREAAAAPFDLARGPLLRCRLFRLAGDEHVLSATLHHAVTDQWSLRVFFAELGALYRAPSGRPRPPLAPLPAQYADYAVWQRKRMRGPEMERQLAYWRARLAGAPPLLELPADRPRPSVQSHRGSRVSATLPRPLADALGELARREGATRYMLLLAAFGVLLARHAGQDDVVVGTPAAGRVRPELEGNIGFFVNSLALRMELGGSPGFRELLARVRRAVLDAHDHQELPFERLVEELRVERSPGYAPLFQVMFVLREGPLAELEIPGVAADVEEVPLGTAKFDLTLAVEERGGRLVVEAEYAADLFDRATAERMLERFRVLLEGIAARPEGRVAELPLLPEAERRVLEAWNDTAREYPADALVHRLFEAQARRTPGAPALLWRGETLDYAELDRRADRLAHLLRARGTGPESRVGVYLERTPAMVVALLAVLKAGGAYVPLDPAYPRERLGYMLEDAGVRVVLTTGALAGRLPAGAAEPLLLDAAPEPGPGSGDASPESGVGPENLSHVIFTSGSTGRPKGVMIRHRSTSVLVHWMREVVSDEERASVLFSTSISFDVSVAEVLGTLCWGGRLVMVENALELPSVAGEGIRYASMVPTAAAELLRTGGFPPSVRTLFLGGEPLPPDLARGLYALGHVRRVGNLYGPTEDTTYSTFALVAEGGAWVDVGRPVADTRARVLDGELQPAPVGVPGELYLAGAGLARGYAGRPDLTAARFLPDPFGGPGERMYRVMDRVRWLPDGTLEYLGRTDTQVKVRGFRIEPGEIEAVLRRHPGVRDAVAVAREDVPSERRLVAYVVPAGAEAPPAAELRAALREALPEYMVPSAIQPLDELPLTPSGKVDRRALPAPGVRPEGAAAGYEAPRTAGEARLARVWEEVLGTGPVGIHDDFFALGGHSLLATRVASRVRALLGIELPLHAVFEAPTLAALAARLDREAEDAAGTGAGDPPLLPRADDGPAPLSFAQERLWFLDRMDPGSAVYNVPVAFRVRGAADAGLLARAVSEVVRRHAVLRSGFAGGSGGPVQTVRPPAPVPLPVVDLAAAAGGRAEAELRRLLREEAARPFDLEAGPLLRTRFFRVAPGEAVLSLTVHHIASDGWSMGILFRELEEVHAALREGRAPALPELPVQYADFAAWQREWLRGERIERQAAYWRERLAGAAVLDLPTDHPRPAVKSYRGGELFFALDAPLAEGVAALAREEGATPYMLLLAAFQLLLSRYAGEDDVVVGTPIAGRTRRETEELIGFFVNTLAIRTRLGGGPTFRELLARVREATLEAYAHQDLPFEKLVEELGVERDLGRSPLFPVMFALQNAPAGGPRLAGAALEPVAVESTTAKFDLTLALAESGRGMDGSLEYAADLFERETVARLAEHFRVLLEGAVARPRAVAAGLPLLGPAERALLEGWSRAGAEAAPRLCVHELFAGQAARTPEAPALVHGGEVLAYGELDRRANRLARHLLRRGVRPGDRVGICLERSPEMVVGLLGILKAGAAYVPLDPGYPADRLAFLLADSAVPLLLTREGLLDRLGEHGAMAVCVDRDRAAIGREGADAPEVRVTPEHLAYVVYTSGSTGEPKGTEVPHRAVPGFFWDVDYVRFDERQVLLQHSSTSWDALTLELWPALLKGGRCVLYPERISEPLGLGEQVRAHGVTTLWISSAYFNLVVDTHPEALAGVRQLMVGGEAVSAPHLRRALELHPGLRLVNGYGPSECTVFASCWPVPPDFAGAAVPIGRPVGDRRVHVLDARSEPVPVGVPGELCVGGDGVGRGYLGRPALTAEKFVPDPFAAAPGVRLYRTGDRARWRADGTLEFLGRTDQQVKLRGFRIEPGEIEAALEAHPAVREAVVLLREDAPGERRLVGYVVGEPGAVPTAAELRTHLRERLPEHLVPAAIVALERLPLTPHGKTDRASLPAPELAAPAAAHVAPRTPTEELLAGIWADVLRRERVGVGESFFELGGHSLLATRVVSRIREAFGVELPLRALFEAPTLERLAARVEAQRAGGPGTAAPPLVPVERAGRLPLSFAQERLWFLEQLSPGGHVYTVPGVLRLEGPLDAGALEAALGEIVRRHEALRTRFPSDGGHPWQEVLPPGSPDAFRLRVEPVAAAEAEGRIRAEVERPFDLERGPLFRAALLRPGADEHVLVLSMHHVVCDGWSLGVLFREWSALYAAYARREASPLEEPAVQYGDYAVWQRAWLHGEALEAQLAYWRGRLAGAPALELPTDHPRPAVQGFAGARHSLTLGADETEGLRRLARREGATLFMVLMGGLQVLLGRYAESEDVVVGSPIAGRTRRETEGLIGLFVNTLALRTDLSGDPAFREVVGRVREGALGAYAHQEVPFERLVEELKVERDLSRSPLVQVMFALHNTPGEALELAGLRAGWLEPEADTAKFDLAIDAIEEEDGGLRLALDYRTELWEAGTMQRLGEHLRRVLAGAAAQPERRIGALELLGAGEREQVLREWNATAAPYAREATVHGLFEAQAARTPEAVAVEGGGEALTYRELDARAGRLAERLRGRGVGPETRVGVCVERGPGMVAALLGVLKAGGAYVPLDPGYPAERLAYMLADAGVETVVATADTAALLPEFVGEVLLLDAAEGAADPRPRAAAPAATADNLAYVIYTSGSTGQPKGVAAPHRGLVSLFQAGRETFGIGAGDVVVALASFAFDIWLFEVLLPLTVGATVRVLPRDRVLDTEALAEELASATVVHAVPVLMRQVAGAVRASARGALPGIRRAFVGGDAVPPDLPAEMATAFPGAELRVLYGPTEATILASSHRVGEGPSGGRIGRPLGNVALYVCDAGGAPVPVGVPGELLIGGAGVTRGYLGRPGLTAERFVPDPFGGEPGGRLYRSGDRARWRADGTLEFLGRVDQQVKIRGFRIEPGEVEAALARHPAVREAVVAVREDAPGDRRLAAYVVPAAEPGRRVELWPSIGEYFVYDPLIYHGLSQDERRNRSYLAALRRLVPGRVVVDVGTGGDAILARLAVEAGARHVYAVDILEQSCEQARQRVAALGLEDRITVLHGDARSVRLPEPADVAVSEIVEAIGGAEGSAVVIDGARRLLRPGGVMVPDRSVTRVAAATLPDELRGELRFTRVSARYVERIFDEVGHPFDLRLCVKDFPPEKLLSAAAVFEDLRYNDPLLAPGFSREVTLQVARDGVLDGFLLWLRLHLDDEEVLDILEERTSWFPVWLPVFDPGIPVAAGDVVRAVCSGTLSDNGVNPDYAIRGTLLRRGAEPVEFEHLSTHHGTDFRATPFYRRLWEGGRIPEESSNGRQAAGELAAELRAHLRATLPEYMVPAAVVVLDRLPLTPTGKTDRQALPAPVEARRAAGAGEAPSTPAEELVAGVWREVLGAEKFGLDDNFFDLGGDSLLMVRVHGRLRAATGRHFTVTDMFRHTTVSSLAGFLESGAGAEPEPPAPERGESRRESLRRAREARRRPGARQPERSGE